MSQNLFQRIVSAVLLLPVVLVPVYWGGWWFSGLLMLGGLLMAVEWVNLTSAGNKVVGVALGAAVAALVAWTTETSPEVVDILIYLLGTALFGALLVKSSLFKQGGWWLIGCAYVSMPLIAMWWLRSIDVWLVIWVFLIVWATDIGGYFAGKGIGGPKLAPKISPKKTWSGLGGGMALSVVASYVMYLVVPLGPSFSGILMLSAALAVWAQVGDLVESGVKRSFDVKDSGGLIPGHGGILDRVDGLVFVAPAMVLIALYAPDII